MKAMGCSFQSSFKFGREICQLPPKHAHDFVYTPKAVNIMLFRKKSLQVWPNQGTYPRKMPPHASSGRERVTGPTKPQEERQWCSHIQEILRNSSPSWRNRRFFLVVPKRMPLCCLMTPSFWLPAGREWSPLILKYQCGIYLAQSQDDMTWLVPGYEWCEQLL